MKTKRKLLILVLVTAFVLLSVTAAIAITFALTQQTIKTSLNISYTAEDINGSVSASYILGGVSEKLTAMKDGNPVGDTLEFKATDTEDAGYFVFPNDGLDLTHKNSEVIIQYTYNNTGSKHFIASMSFDAELKYDNMKVEYSINGSDYSTDRYAVVVPSKTTDRSYWIKISIDDKRNDASFEGDFNWLLEGTDELSEEEYVSLSSVTMQGSEGSYSASFSGDYLPGGEITFPSSVNGDAVTTITANTALTDTQKTQVKSVTIPDSVTTVGDNAFDGYTSLEQVNFSGTASASGVSAQSTSALTTIGAYAFQKCTSLKAFDIPSTVTSVGTYAFSNCDAITSIKIPYRIAALPNRIFAGCDNLTEVILPYSLTKLGHYTFFSCPKLTNVILPSDVSAIGNYSFANCVSLESIELPETVSSIGTYGFYKCTSLKEIFINGPVDKVASNSFSGCTNLEKFILKKDINSIARRASSETNLFAVLSKNIPLYLSTDLENPLTDIVLDSATSVGNYAFYGHKYIKSITLGNSVKNVGVRAFSKCENLKTIKLTNNFGGSGYAQFYDCPNLEKVIVDDINFYAQNFGSISYGVHNSDKAGLYLSSDPDKLLTDIVIDTATEIELHAFANYTTIKSVYIGNSVKEIQNYAFENCTGLTSVTIAESVTVIGFQAFNNSSLTSATFEVTNGWYLAYSKGATSGTAISAEEMANKSTAATHLLISNDNYCLKRSTTN